VLPATIARSLYPFDGKTLDRRGLRYHYLDEGAGEPVIMLHGNPTWSFHYRGLIAALRADYRVIVPDHMGMGLSDKPDDAGGRYQYRLASRVDDLAALVEALDLPGRITLVMHDWGGMIGMAYASRHPQRIARLVLFNTAAFHLPASMRLPRSLRLVRDTPLGALAVRGAGAFSRMAARLCCTRRPLTPELRAAYCAPYHDWASRIGILRFVQDIPLRPSDPSYALVSEVADSLPLFRNTPVLICWGERDFVFTPEVLELWRRHWPEAQIHRFADCGHYLLEDAGEEVQALVREFLEAGAR
jgi:pimeloyl-ACP methyl ester carboxylesterase